MGVFNRHEMGLFASGNGARVEDRSSFEGLRDRHTSWPAGTYGLCADHVPRRLIVRAFEYKLAAGRRVDPERKCDRFKVRHAADLWTSVVLQHPLSPRFTSTNKARSRARMSIYEA